MRKIARVLFIVFRLAITIGPFIWIATFIDWGSLRASASQVAWWTIPTAALLLLLSMFLQGLRWWILIRELSPSLPFGRTIAAHFKGVYYSIMLPTSAAQDVVRAALLAGKDDYATIWGASWVCRLFGMFAIVLCALAGLFLIDTRSLPRFVPVFILIFILLSVILIGLSFTKRITRHARPLIARVLPERVFRVLEAIRQAVFLYRDHKKGLAVTFLWTLLMQTVAVSNGALMLLGIAGMFPFGACLFFIPAVELVVTLAPLTPGGVGLREFLMKFFLVDYLKLENEQMGIYIAIGLLGMLLRLVGGVFVLHDRILKRAAAGSKKDTRSS